MAPSRIKRSDQTKDWYKRGLERRQNTRRARDYILIVCEGERTEPQYFEGLKETLPEHLVIIKTFGIGDNTLSLVKRALEVWENEEPGNLGRRYDKLWVVFDKDSFPSDQFDNAINYCEARRRSATEQLESGTEEPDVPLMYAAWSNEAFEIWYVLHFQDRITAMPRKEYEGVLSTSIGQKYKKNDRHMYRTLQTYGDEALALRRAARLFDTCQKNGTAPSNSNPCTTIFQLVEELIQYKTSGGRYNATRQNHTKT